MSALNLIVGPIYEALCDQRAAWQDYGLWVVDSDFELTFLVDFSSLRDVLVAYYYVLLWCDA